MYGRPRMLAVWLLQLGLASSAGAQPLTLEQAVKLSLERNERAEAAVRLSEAGRAREARARAFFFPELSATGNYIRRSVESVRDGAVFQSRNALNGAAQLRWALFDGRAIPLYRQARREAEATALESVQARRLLAFEAADAFLQTLSAEGVAEAARRRLQFARRSYDDSRARFEAQLVSSNDVTRAQLELSTAEREATRAQGARGTAYLNLGYLLNLDTVGALAAPTRLLATAADAPTDEARLIILAEQRRPDVLAQQKRAQAAWLFAQEPRWRLLPSLFGVGQFRVTNEPGFNRPYDGLLGLELSWTLFDGGERYAERDERVALARVAELTAQASMRAVGLEVRTALLALATAQAALREAQVAAQVAQRNAEETSELYRQGLTGALEVADASVRLFEAEVGLERERFNLGLAFFDLRSALGLDPLGDEVSE